MSVDASSFSGFYRIAKKSFILLSNNNPLVLASSTAFFATFSLAPITLLLVTLLGFFIRDEIIRSEILQKIQYTFGETTADTVRGVLGNLHGITQNRYVSLFGFGFLVFISTTLLIVVQNSINQLWGIKQKTEKHVLRAVKDRMLSLLIIMVTGLLILVSFLTQTVLAFIRRYLHSVFPKLNLSLIEILNEVFSFLVVIIWFAIIYRFLPAAKMQWRAIWTGSVVTSLLFSFGRFLLLRLLPSTNIATVYGASGSVILILLFVFYSALIFYLGASFTHTYAVESGYTIVPKSYAVRVKIVELD